MTDLLRPKLEESNHHLLNEGRHGRPRLRNLWRTTTPPRPGPRMNKEWMGWTLTWMVVLSEIRTWGQEGWISLSKVDVGSRLGTALEMVGVVDSDSDLVPRKMTRISIQMAQRVSDLSSVAVPLS